MKKLASGAFSGGNGQPGGTLVGADVPPMAKSTITPKPAEPKLSNPAPEPAPNNKPLPESAPPPNIPTTAQAPAKKPGVFGALGGVFNKGMEAFNDYRNAPPGTQDAMKLYQQTVGNDNMSWMNPEKIRGADQLSQFYEQHKANPVVQKYVTPEMKDKLQQLNGPVGSVARFGIPMLHGMTGTPENFARFANMPLIRDILKPVLGTAGLPALALMQQYMSGDMTHWNTLMRKPGCSNNSSKDIVDQHLENMQDCGNS